MQFRNRRKTERRNPRSNEEVISLTSLPEGERGVITDAFGGFGLVRRLAEMGLTPGAEIKLVRKCPFSGPLEIEVRGSELALGYGVASKVFVRPLKAESNG
jgi:Fe2+ transport system protein FeoA